VCVCIYIHCAIHYPHFKSHLINPTPRQKAPPSQQTSANYSRWNGITETCRSQSFDFWGLRSVADN